MRKFEASEKKRHISIRAINLSLVVVVVLFSAIVECISILVEKQYTAAADVQNTYTICSDAADVLQKESDNLSFAIEEYVITQDLDAVERYNPNKDIKFKTYARLRINCAIYDGLRKMLPSRRYYDITEHILRFSIISLNEISRYIENKITPEYLLEKKEIKKEVKIKKNIELELEQVIIKW